jgi:energy-coupling factor transporter ATP-binding protein EcfA2
MSRGSASTEVSDKPLPEPACARIAAFCTPGPEIFQSIVYQPQIWQTDRFDVETIHAEARERFAALLARAGAATPATPGRLLLLHGQAGSGKTHLMRAFRGMTHADGAGYFAYLQMTTEAGNYGRYLLSNLVASFDQPYHPPFNETSGLLRLSSAVMDAVPDVSPDARAALRDGSVADPHAAVHEYADRLLLDRRITEWGVDLDPLRALLHLQREDPRVKGKILKWLRCEDLSSHDRQALGDLVPRTQEEHPIHMVSQLGRIMAALQEAPLAICVDQLEDMFNHDMAAERFRRVVDTLVALLDQVPSAVVVLSCLEDYYIANKGHLTRSKVDRLERDPEPVRLQAQRSFDEITAMVSKRLEVLYEDAGLYPRPEPSVYPFRAENLRPLTNLTTRDVLDCCRRHHEQCIIAETWVEPAFDAGGSVTEIEAIAAPAAPTLDLESAWNDFLNQPGRELPEDEAKLAELLAWGIDHCNAELQDLQFVPTLDGTMMRVERQKAGALEETFVVAICQKSPQGGWLGRQISEVERWAAGLPVVLVRSYAFPKNPRTQVASQIGKLIGTTGRRVEVEDSDWRALLALRAFAAAQAGEREYAAWQRESRPLSQLAAMQKTLALDRLGPAMPTTASPPKPSPMAPPPSVIRSAPKMNDSPAGDLLLGQTRGISNSPVLIAPAELKQHLVVLGGTGSGKTTAALSLVEQLLLRGIPAVLVDRKGDLCRYADPAAWTDSADPRAAARLRDRLDVALFTPGASDGRPLVLPIVPQDMAQLSTADREQLAEFSAAAIGGMMGYRPGRSPDKIQLVILAKAIGVLAEAASDGPVTVDHLQELVQSQDALLLNAVNGYEAKHYKRLAEDLLTLKLGQSRLLAAPGAERLDIDALLGRGAAAVTGKTRLSIISTQFLGSAAAIDFWVSQFLIALDRWRLKSPSEELQAIVLLDEADQYLPAVRQPATKAPLESLLRRARSAGIGFILATQSPGDLDYKSRENIRSWLAGRVNQDTALTKLKPLFADTPIDVAAKLPSQQTGEFFLLRGRQAIALNVARSCVEAQQVAEQTILQWARATR